MVVEGETELTWKRIGELANLPSCQEAPSASPKFCSRRIWVGMGLGRPEAELFFKTGGSDASFPSMPAGSSDVEESVWPL